MARLEDDFTNIICGTYDHSIDTIDPDEPSDLPGPISDEEAEWLEEKVLTSMGV